MVCGSSNFGRRLRRRTSTGSIPSSAANRSIARSTAAIASGRPAPRYAATGVVLVTTLRAEHSTRGMSYTLGAMVRVIITGSTAAKPG